MSKTDYTHETHDITRQMLPHQLFCRNCWAQCYEDGSVVDPNMFTKNKERLTAPCTESPVKDEPSPN